MLWTSAIIQEVWHHWQVVWTQRNHMIHGHDETSQSAALRRRAEIMLHEIYSRKDIMKPSNRDKILFEDIEHHLAQKYQPNHELDQCAQTSHQPQYQRNRQISNMRSMFHADLFPCSAALTRSASRKCNISLTHFCGPATELLDFSFLWSTPIVAKTAAANGAWNASVVDASQYLSFKKMSTVDPCPQWCCAKTMPQPLTIMIGNGTVVDGSKV